MQRLGSPAEALAMLATGATVALMAVSVAPGRSWVALAVIVAVLWGAAPTGVDLLAQRSDDDDHDDDTPCDGTVTVVVRLGSEPDEIARATVGLARSVGPVHVLGAAPSSATTLDALGALDGVTVHRSGLDGATLQTIAAGADTDGVLIISARAVPLADTCRRAAGRLDDSVGWVIGRSRPFNPDRYGSDRREVVGAELRHRCGRIGLLTWETDATLVRTDLLATHATSPHRPLGQWLRERSGEGHRGIRTGEDLSLRAAPVASGSYWPDTVARQRASAADLAGALGHGPSRARLCAAGLIARELYAWPLLLWLLMPVVLVAGAPFVGRGTTALALLALVALRWFALRVSLGVDCTPQADLAAAALHAPGSLAASAAVLTRRIHPPRWAMPTRPLVWAGLVGTLVAGYGLVATPPGSSSSRVAAAASLLLLGLLWALTIRSLVEKNWERSSFRVRLDLPARVGGVDGRVLDGSPAGLAFHGAPGDIGIGHEVQVEVGLDVPTVADEVPDGAGWITLQAVVASRRHRGDRELWGLELHADGDAAERWAAQLLRSARARLGTPQAQSPPAVPAEARRSFAAIVDKVVLSFVVATSVAVLGALVLVLLGFTPLVIRSGSMEPSYGIGDIVLVEQVPANELRVGDVASLDEYGPIGESMTHRVRSITPVGAMVEVETRGDANDSSERWAIAEGDSVGVVRGSVPALGAPATLARTSASVLAIAVVSLGLVVAMVLGGARLRRGREGGTGPVAEGDLATTDAGQPEPPRTARRAP